MDNVLIVDGDREHLTAIRNGLKELHHFELLTSLNGKTAIETLQQSRVSVIVTSMLLPDMDGVDLVAYLTRNHAATPCIIMIEPGHPSPVFPDPARSDMVLSYIEKPFAFGTLASMIFAGLNLKDEGLSKKGITLGHLLPLAGLCNKTFRMEVTSGTQKKGFLYFKNGRLLDALFNNQSGEDVARKMAAWDQIMVAVSPLPDKRDVQRINARLIEIAGANWKQPTSSAASTPRKSAAASRAVSQAKTAQTPPASPAVTSQAPPGAASRLEAALQRYSAALRAIKGYRGLAILSPDGTLLAADTAGENLDFASFAAEFNNIISYCNKTAAQKGFDQCSGVTLHTKKGIIIMMASDVYKHGNFRFIGLLSPDANGYFMQIQMEKAIPQILSTE
jgi:DNA-binding response OmpR family regulator/predicted regulator of Ras-like GTPase activity (Roadblock/LC7/MglB family)